MHVRVRQEGSKLAGTALQLAALPGAICIAVDNQSGSTVLDVFSFLLRDFLALHEWRCLLELERRGDGGRGHREDASCLLHESLSGQLLRLA